MSALRAKKNHVKKLSSGKGRSSASKGCYFTTNNCDDHTCSTGNGQGCNTLITCTGGNTGGGEYNGICTSINYGGCTQSLACRPSENHGRASGVMIEDDAGISAFIRSIANRKPARATPRM